MPLSQVLWSDAVYVPDVMVWTSWSQKRFSSWQHCCTKYTAHMICVT